METIKDVTKKTNKFIKNLELIKDNIFQEQAFSILYIKRQIR